MCSSAALQIGNEALRGFFYYFYHLSSRNPAESVYVKECGHFSAEVVFNGLEIKVSATQHCMGRQKDCSELQTTQGRCEEEP